MTKKNKYTKASSKTQEQAISMAKATQRPGQTKEQTKLIAQGIEKGIALYKKQHKAKSRELNKKINKASQSFTVMEALDSSQTDSNDKLKRSWLPWFLLIISWLGFAVFLMR